MASSTALSPSVPASPALAWARSTAAAASLGAAAVHAAAIPVHFDHGTRYGVAFVVMAAFGTAATITPMLARWRRGLGFTLAVNVAILALWFLATNRGVPGDEKEAIAMAGAVATMLELAAVTAAAVGLAFGASAERGAARVGAGRGGWRAPVVALGAVALLAAPGVATAADHQHGDAAASTTGHAHANAESGVSGNVAASSITGIFSTAPAAAHAGGSGNATHDDQVGAACAPSDGQVAAADALVAASTLALVKYRDVTTAVADGYRPLGFEPNGVNHYINESYLHDERTVDPQHPESILYGRNRDGSLYPIGLMFMTGSAGERGPRIGGCLTPWHRHGFPFARPGETSVEMMHVWTIAVPGGPYAEHVEGEYARIYLGVEPIDTDISDPTASATGTNPSTSLPFERLVGLFGAGGGNGTGFGVGAMLNALNVHRATLCAEPLHTQLLLRVKDAALVDRICDPILNGPLPGASAPDMGALLKQFTAKKTGN